MAVRATRLTTDDSARQFHWQLERLNRLEVFDIPQVNCLLKAGVSWHEVEDLLNRGCPPQLVVEILT